MPSAWLAMYAVCGVTLFVEPQSHLRDVTWPAHAFVTLPAGWVKPAEQMFVLEGGRPINAQVEVAARWPDGSPKWVHAYASLRYAGGKPAAYEFEKRSKLPAEIPKSPLSVVDKPQEITIDTGPLKLVIGRPFSITVLDRQGEPVIRGPGGPGMVDGRAIEWSAALDDKAEIVVEQQGPAQVTVKASGWYQSSDKRVEPFCRFVTRISAFAGSGIIKFDHATIFADDMRKHAIAELPFVFTVPGVQAYASGGLRDKFSDNLTAKWFAQLAPQRLVTLDQPGPTLPLKPEIAGEYQQSAGWFAADRAGSRVVLLTKDFWQKCPKEVKIGRDPANAGGPLGELTYYAWPKHGALGKPTKDSLEPQEIYKFQCFHVGKLLQSRLPGEYVAALEQQTDTTECKPEYAAAANLQGVAMHNEFALAYLPTSGKSPHDDNYVAGLQRLYAQSPIARVSPTAVALSGVLGPVAASGAVPAFSEQDRAARDGMLGYAGSIARYGDYGWAIYGNTHEVQLMNPDAAGVPGGRPSLHRVWNNNHYQHVSTSWRLYALDEDPALGQWARTCTDNYASIGQVRYDPLRGYEDGKGVRQPGPEVKFHWPGGFYHCKGLVPWGGRDYGMDKNDVDAALTGHWPDPSGLLYAWLFDANRWAKEGYELWRANVEFPTTGTRREANTTLVHAITAYEYQPKPETLAAIKSLIHDKHGLASEPLVTQNPGPLFEPTWLSRAYELMPDDAALKKYLVASADAAGVELGSASTMALSATAYRITGDDKYLRRHAAALERVKRSVFYDPKPDKRWDRYGFGPAALGDSHFMLQWHRFLAALKDAKITSLPAPVEAGQYLGGVSRTDSLKEAQLRGTEILVLRDTPSSKETPSTKLAQSNKETPPTAIELQGASLRGGDIHTTSLTILAPDGKVLNRIERLPMSDRGPYRSVMRPSGFHSYAESYPIEDAGAGLYRVLLASSEFGAFQPLTGLPECQVLKNVKLSNWSEPCTYRVKIARGYLVPLTKGRISLKVTAVGANDPSHVAVSDRNEKLIVSQAIRAGDSVNVVLDEKRAPGPWLLDTQSNRTGFVEIEISADVDEPLLYGSDPKNIQLIREKLRK